jgi:hypothetical protein
MLVPAFNKSALMALLLQVQRVMVVACRVGNSAILVWCDRGVTAVAWFRLFIVWYSVGRLHCISKARWCCTAVHIVI